MQQRKDVFLANSFHPAELVGNSDPYAAGNSFRYQVEQSVGVTLVFIPNEFVVLSHHLSREKNSGRGEPAHDLFEQVFEIDHVMDRGVC